MAFITGAVIVLFILEGINIFLFKGLGQSISYEVFLTSFFPAFQDMSKEILYRVSLIIFSFLTLLIFGSLIKVIKKYADEKKESTKINKIFQKVERNFQSRTSLDTLYHALKEIEKIKISSIMDFFEVTKEQANIWVKMLEEHNIITVEYSPFSEPKISLKKEGEAEEISEKGGVQEKVKGEDLKTVIKKTAVKKSPKNEKRKAKSRKKRKQVK